MTSVILPVSSGLRIRSWTRPVTTRISEAGTRPSPVMSGTRRWAIAPLQGRGEHHPRLVLQVGREEVDDAVDRLGRVQGVDGGEDEVAGLGGGERGADRLLVAHLADQDHVGVLAQDAAHRAAEALGVGADFALVDDRAFVFVQVLDRVLEGDDVVAPGCG